MRKTNKWVRGQIRPEIPQEAEDKTEAELLGAHLEKAGFFRKKKCWGKYKTGGKEANQIEMD